MTEIYFITDKQLRETSLIDPNVESAYLRQAIITALDIDLQEIIGSALYTSLRDQIKESEFKSEIYTQLIDEYITPFLINDIMGNITIPLHFKIKNAGIVTNNDQHYQAASLNEVTYVEQHYKNLATFNANRLSEFLFKNKNLFEELNCNNNWLQPKLKNTNCPIHFRK